jgi:hypothetical protein
MNHSRASDFRVETGPDPGHGPRNAKVGSNSLIAGKRPG